MVFRSGQVGSGFRVPTPKPLETLPTTAPSSDSSPPSSTANYVLINPTKLNAEAMVRHSKLKTDASHSTAAQRVSQKLRSSIQTPRTDKASIAVLSTDSLSLPDNAIDTSHNLVTIHVVQGSSIESKVKQILAALLTLDAKTTVSVLSRAPAANKCVSVVEIAKREFTRNEKKRLFQYTGYWTRLEQLPTTAEQLDDSDGFEPVRRTLVRNIPCLVVYLSTKPLASLKILYK
jgi:hypothetical protein